MRNWFKEHRVTILLVLSASIGLGLLLYPSFSDWWNSFHQSRAVASYMEAVADLDASKYSEVLMAAEDYNAKLAKTGALWIMDEEQEKDYSAQLNVNDTGIMGYINIPKIRVQLPVYHGIDEAVLQIAVGHLQGTSLPVGGRSTHCAVSGHRGLPSARLFTDLDKIVEGDTFTMTVLNRTVTYQVDQIRVVEPSDLSGLQIVNGKDYCTLITCTPYGINTHRLLIRGHRVDNAQGDALVTADAMQIESVYIAPFLAVPLLIFLFLLMMTRTGSMQRANRALDHAWKQYGWEEEKPDKDADD